MRFKSLLFVCFVLLANHTGTHAQESNFVSNPVPSVLGADTLSTSPAFLSSDEEFLPVEKAYILNLEFEDSNNDQFNHLRLNWQIANGYYLYRHGFKFEPVNLQGKQTNIDIRTQIPDGKAKIDDYFGRVEVYHNYVDITLSTTNDTTPFTLAITSQGCADAGLCYPPRTQYFHIDKSQNSITTINKPAMKLATNKLKNNTSQTSQSLLYMLLLAILGGSVLNLMPCVFPVLSLKVLSFANDKEHNKLVHGLVYSLGVIISFVVVAAILISLQAAGEAVGWGFHLQSPWFVATLVYLFFVMGLSLSGFIEFGSQWMNTGSSLASKSGYSGSFFTGVLATVVASPCTAPFMGTALGFAVTQSTPVALSVFAALGFGMSLPLLLLSSSPNLLNKIPKPGPWMVRLKELLAFPLYATAVWLCWVVGKQSGVSAMAAVLLGCVLITLSLWLWGEGHVKRVLSTASAALAITLLAGPLLNASNTETNNWKTYNPEILSQLRQQGKPVFINVTADWCITCLANEKITLSTDRVKQAFIDSGVTYLKGDWTNHDATITHLLNQHGRTGIPLYLVYPSDSSQDATLLPQILTADVVIEALAQASR
ncbi:MAG: protein-disulfide reductase DsbD [Spongiibacteraceae bacterium]|nr:protein-disulfide reductase DsbD [Spongiibacteraceae bacterium]